MATFFSVSGKVKRAFSEVFYAEFGKKGFDAHLERFGSFAIPYPVLRICPWYIL